MKKIKLHRVEDVNLTSGVGDVWEGVQFDNGYVAGCWRSDTTSYGWYDSISALEKIHGHQGRTKIVESEYGELLQVVTDKEHTTDGYPLVAQAYMASDGWIAILYLAKYHSRYWHRNIQEMDFVMGKRSRIEPYSQNDNYAWHHPIWKRDHIFPQTD